MGKTLKQAEIASLGDFPVEFDKNGRGLCPFHEDSRPSLTVFESKYGGHRYHCFACGAKGWLENLAGDISGDYSGGRKFNPIPDKRSRIREEYVALVRDWEATPADDYFKHDHLIWRAENLFHQEGIASRLGYLWAVEEGRVAVTDTEHLVNLHRLRGGPEEAPIVGRLDPFMGLRSGGSYERKKMDQFSGLVKSGVVENPYAMLHTIMVGFDQRRIEERLKNGETLESSDFVLRHAAIAARGFWRTYLEGIPS